MKKECKGGAGKSSGVISDRPALLHHTPAFQITFITDAIFGEVCVCVCVTGEWEPGCYTS